MRNSNLESSFEDKRSTYLWGVGAWVYWFYHWAAGESSTKVLPGLSMGTTCYLFAAALAFQVFVWIYFKHFQRQWYLKPKTYVFFICEFGILTFTFAFLMWPVFLMFKSKLS